MGTLAGVRFTTPRLLPSGAISPGLLPPCTCATVGHALLSRPQLAAYSNLKFSLPVAVREETTSRKKYYLRKA